MALYPGLPGWAGTRKVKPIWILLKQETVGSSGISWAICKSALRHRQIPTPEPHHSIFTGRMPFLPPNQQRQSTEGTDVKVNQYAKHYSQRSFISQVIVWTQTELTEFSTPTTVEIINLAYCHLGQWPLIQLFMQNFHILLDLWKQTML